MKQNDIKWLYFTETINRNYKIKKVIGETFWTAGIVDFFFGKFHAIFIDENGYYVNLLGSENVIILWHSEMLYASMRAVSNM